MITDLRDRDLRQREIIPPEKLAGIHALVIGVGAVGRQVAMQLAATGVPELTLVDDDVVNVVNLGPQAYSPSDIGMHKVDATRQFCALINPDVVIHPQAERFRRSSSQSLPCFAYAERRLAIFTCVDSISARGIIWEAVKDRVGFFVDARMNAEVVRVLAADHPASDNHYSTTLFSQAEAHVGACTARSTLYTAAIAAGLMLSQFTRWLRGIPTERDLIVNLLTSEVVMQ